MSGAQPSAAVLVRFGGEAVGVERLFGQAALRDEVAPRRVDHHRRTTGIDLVAGQVARTHTRLVIARNLSDQNAVARYHQYLDERKAAGSLPSAAPR